MAMVTTTYSSNDNAATACHNCPSFTISDVECWDKAKEWQEEEDGHLRKKHSGIISTGIGYFDHMIDQMNSHAQIGVSIMVNTNNATSGNSDDVVTKNNGNFHEGQSHQEHDLNGASASMAAVNRNAAHDQTELAKMVGTALGTHLKTLLPQIEDNGKDNKKHKKIDDESSSSHLRSRFCCPLDEALVECTIERISTTRMILREDSLPSSTKNCHSNLEYKLAPYGKYPQSTGRITIGAMQTSIIEFFFQALSSSMKIKLSLQKIRGENGHHITESAFKSFARALRCLMDGTSIDDVSAMWGKGSISYTRGVSLNRFARHERRTKETSIVVEMHLDGGIVGTEIRTGIQTLDILVLDMVKECPELSLQLQCAGDLWIDDHHTTEDVAIAVGQVLNKSLGTKAGLNRMWTSSSSVGEAEVEVVMDISNRPYFGHNLNLNQSTDCEKIGDLSVEMVIHFFDSLVVNGQMTVHVVQTSQLGSVRDLSFAAARAFGRALSKCFAVDPRRAGATASSKGTLSV